MKTKLTVLTVLALLSIVVFYSAQMKCVNITIQDQTNMIVIGSGYNWVGDRIHYIEVNEEYTISARDYKCIEGNDLVKVQTYTKWFDTWDVYEDPFYLFTDYNLYVRYEYDNLVKR